MVLQLWGQNWQCPTVVPSSSHMIRLVGNDVGQIKFNCEEMLTHRGSVCVCKKLQLLVVFNEKHIHIYFWYNGLTLKSKEPKLSSGLKE